MPKTVDNRNYSLFSLGSSIGVFDQIFPIVHVTRWLAVMVKYFGPKLTVLNNLFGSFLAKTSFSAQKMETLVKKFCLSTMEMLVKNGNFGQKWKFWSKIDIWSKINILSNKKFLFVKNQQFVKKIFVGQKMEILVKNRYLVKKFFAQKWKFWSKIDIWSKTFFAQKWKYWSKIDIWSKNFQLNPTNAIIFKILIFIKKINIFRSK